MSQQKTTDTKSVQEERIKLLKKAQQFVYPVGASRKRITIISTLVFAVFVVIFIGMSATLIYGFKSETKFTHQISKILPFPIGRVESNIVTYEEYLFELRPNLHFLVEQEDLDVSSSEAKKKIAELRKDAKRRSYENEIVRLLAKESNIQVKQEEIDQRIAILKTQASDFNVANIESLDSSTPKSGGSDQRFEEILAEFYDWDVNDLRRALEIQMLKSKLPPKLDTATRDQAETVRTSAIGETANFRELAAEFSDDTDSAQNGGELGFLTAETSVAFPRIFLETANELSDGEVSEVFETDFGLHFMKRLSTNENGEPSVAHILFEFKTSEELLEAKKIKDRFVVKKYL